jgi:hypothetical protein
LVGDEGFGVLPAHWFSNLYVTVSLLAGDLPLPVEVAFGDVFGVHDVMGDLGLTAFF